MISFDHVRSERVVERMQNDGASLGDLEDELRVPIQRLALWPRFRRGRTGAEVARGENLADEIALGDASAARFSRKVISDFLRDSG